MGQMRLSHWLAVVFALFGAILAGGIVARHVAVARGEAYIQTERLGKVTLTAVQALVQSQVRQGRFIELGRHLEDLVVQAGIGTVVVRDGKGRRLVGRSHDPALVTREPKFGRRLAEVNDGLYDIEGQVDLGPRGKGKVQIGLRTDRLEGRLRDIGAEGVQLGVSAFLAITLAAWLFGLWAGRRIERVVSRIETLSANPDRFKPLRVEGSDEVSRLAGAFNRMGLNLKSETVRRRELEAEKRELAAMLVHDLKTPLTVIRSGITLLADIATVDGKRANNRTFELLEMSTLRLQRMVEDVLQLAKLEESEAGQQQLVELHTLAKACAKDFELVAADRKQKVAFKQAKGEFPPVLGDPALLRRVLDNLVHNAVEHTPQGGKITIGVGRENGSVLVEVSDSGPGVPPEAREHIFRKFFQKDVKRHVGNVGLGLALCEKVVLRHGGRIGIGDAEPKGARFYFTIPVAPPPEGLS
jgi:signal transduction histidine kinase